MVVCAGAVGSPKLLLLSGIGPAEQLIDHGIEVIADLPGVGRNLQEHPSIPLVFEVSTRTLNQDASDPVQLAKHVADFVVRGRGAITSPAAHAVAFGRFDAQAAAPDFELIFTALRAGGGPGGRRGRSRPWLGGAPAARDRRAPGARRPTAIRWRRNRS